MGRSVFPDDAVTRIYKPSRAVTASGRARANGWRLVFERQGLTYVAQTARGQTTSKGRSRRVHEKPAQAGGSTHAFSDAKLDRLGLAALQESYGRALDGAANRDDLSGPESWSSPMGVIRDPIAAVSFVSTIARPERDPAKNGKVSAQKAMLAMPFQRVSRRCR